MRNRKIGVLMGGISSEKQVSMESGHAVLAALDSRGFDAEPIFVDRDIDMVLRQRGIEAAFIALHGRYGEDGCIQGLLEVLGIPYTGSDVLASALSMNKIKSKQMFRIHNLPTPPAYVATRDERVDRAREHGTFGFPAVVKPVSEGSSVGVHIAHDMPDLIEAIDRAFCFDRQVLVERFVAGVEVSVGVLADRTLGAVEVVPEGTFYDFRAKYSSDDTEYFMPPRLSPERIRGVLMHGLRAHRALGCSGATRVDMIVSDVGNETILEVNTSPGMTLHSLLPKIAHAAGMDFDELVEEIMLGADLDHLDRSIGDRRSGGRSYSGLERRIDGAAEHH